VRVNVFNLYCIFVYFQLVLLCFKINYTHYCLQLLLLACRYVSAVCCTVHRRSLLSCLLLLCGLQLTAAFWSFTTLLQTSICYLPGFTRFWLTLTITQSPFNIICIFNVNSVYITPCVVDIWENFDSVTSATENLYKNCTFNKCQALVWWVAEHEWTVQNMLRDIGQFHIMCHSAT